MEQSDPELPRLRRFALFVGLTLWAYVLAGGSVGKMLQVPALGLTLTFTRTHLLEWGLVLICIYATARYGYHSLVKSLTPWKARKLLQTGQFGPMSIPPSNQAPETRAIASRYLPGFDDVSVVKRLSDTYGFIGASGAGKYPGKVRIWIALDDMDYTAPLWMNGFAIIAFVISRIFYL